jgi:hypothetical protein
VSSVPLHDKATIERVLRRNVYLHLYSIGDLDDFFWPYTVWYATADGAEIRFRLNRRSSRSRGKLSYRLVQQAVGVEPVRGGDLRCGRRILRIPNQW